MTKYDLDIAEKADIIGTPLADLGRYASLVYGISHAVGNEPELDKVIYAGIAYLACSFLNNFLKKGVIANQINELENKLLDE